jgi:periplasmic divalent cation tolerance protein
MPPALRARAGTPPAPPPDPSADQDPNMIASSTEVKAVVALCTCPDRATARRLARAAVERRLAACVNLVDGVTSVYAWEGRIEEDAEILLVAKTTAAGFAALETAWREAHPYELPEIIAVDVTQGSGPYLAWIDAAVSS